MDTICGDIKCLAELRKIKEGIEESEYYPSEDNFKQYMRGIISNCIIPDDVSEELKENSSIVLRQMVILKDMSRDINNELGTRDVMGFVRSSLSELCKLIKDIDEEFDVSSQDESWLVI